MSYNGVYVDDVVAPGGAGSTSFEDDADPLDGWTADGGARRQPGQHEPVARRQRVRRSVDRGQRRAALAREPEIIDFLSGFLGRYPFGSPAASWTTTRASASPWRTRPGRSTPRDGSPRPVTTPRSWFTSWLTSGPVTTWRSRPWQHIWLNEGFASYMEWLWSEDGGDATAQEIFDFYAAIPADDALLDDGDR